jgi:hypothetical protein
LPPAMGRTQLRRTGSIFPLQVLVPFKADR